mmetsp:Transcript_35205/g.99664  ORF Transcript_35205/g.99664 Transcript_35205/m.99664 type:complete len:388 (-) Transcript_35205:23-1186(-)
MKHRLERFPNKPGKRASAKAEEDLGPVDNDLQALLAEGMSAAEPGAQTDQDVLRTIGHSINAYRREPKETGTGAASINPLRGAKYMSAANPQKAKEIRRDRAGNLKVSASGLWYFDESPGQLVLPSFQGYPRELRSLVLHSLVDATAQSKAEATGVINSSLYCSRQYVLNTLGDGNCLSNACSLGVWGVNDRDQQLRRAIKDTMTSSGAGSSIQQRFNQQLANQGLGSQDWEKEWSMEVAVCSNTSRYLSDVHGFVLANVLRRPIIIYGNEQAMLAGMAGIYLPLLWDPSQCSAIPISVLYNANHFSLLCVIEGESPSGDFHLLQLTAAGGLPPPLRFGLPGEDPEQLAARYMVVLEMPDGAKAAVFQGRAQDNALVGLMTAVLQRQ